MTKQEDEPRDLQPRKINRNVVYISLAIAAFFALPVAIFIAANGDMTEEEANEPIDLVFYQTTEQCEADTKKQQDEYAASLKKYQAEKDRPGQITPPPTAPMLQTKDCAAQMQAAQEAHNKTAPVYASLADCQAEGVKCETTPAGAPTAGYQPSYGGTYIDPYSSNYTVINTGNTHHRVYETHTVYQSNTPGRLVTSYGREIAQTATGRVTAPRHTSFTAPTRPAGVSGAGTIRGRSSQGFGSSFKSTGRGGK
ncbi:DUF1190 domain-containing protein [Chamaesiphon minutus]|uniref:DUF1190 domain-containing protein n=1 Tax=Chamaesiphon minutus (strain ATCC 27169 / PCC 6605) TaxID=1173020 RepID=K9UMP0_CHAP6|nr:DUF1190 domain-containing protein [Chamaesiphon minutus]AFY96357.1 Protein of unknown function (DUF1190) [Chamaesiphon minutus PCC 6605]